MNDKIEIKPQVISPLKKICMTIGELPTSYLETMTYYEMLVWFTNYLRDTIIPVVNNNGEAVTELQQLFVELQTYVNNYFDNLDVQEEINNKLDEMVSDGTIDNIISKFINTKSPLIYDNEKDLKNSNIQENINVITLGKFKKDDGMGGFYKTNNVKLTDYDIELNNGLFANKIDNFAGTFTKELFGNYNDATVLNINNTGIRAQVSGYNPESQIATYPDRDHVITYSEFRTIQPNQYTILETTETSVTLNEIPKAHIGSIVDLFINDDFNKNQKYSGIVTNIENNTLYVNHWYYMGNTETGQIPENVTLARIDTPTKVWVRNTNLLLSSESNVEEGVIDEMGLFNYLGPQTHPNARANGLDMINFVGKSDFGYMARTTNNRKEDLTMGFCARQSNYGFVSRDTNIAFATQNIDGANYLNIDNKGGMKYVRLPDNNILDSGNGVLKIDNTGRFINYCSKSHIESIENSEIDITAFSVFILIGTNTKTIPNGIEGQIIEIYSARGTNNLLINGVSYALERYKTARLLFKGGYWIDLNNNLQLPL